MVFYYCYQVPHQLRPSSPASWVTVGDDAHLQRTLLCMFVLYFSAQPLGFSSVGLAPLCVVPISGEQGHTDADLAHACCSNMNSYLHRCVTRVLIIYTCTCLLVCVFPATFLPLFTRYYKGTSDCLTLSQSHVSKRPSRWSWTTTHPQIIFTDTRTLPRGKGGHCLPWSVASAASLVALILPILLSNLADLSRIVPVQNQTKCALIGKISGCDWRQQLISTFNVHS